MIQTDPRAEMRERGMDSRFLRWVHRYGLTLAIYGLLLLATRPFYLGDTATYSINILNYTRGVEPADALWEFGHLYLRPIGLLLYRLLWPLTPGWLDLNEKLVIASGLIGLSIVCAAVTAILIQSLATQVSGSVRIGYVTAISTLTFHGVLNYTQSGHAYIAALMLLTLGVWIIVRARQGGRLSAGRAWASGAAVGGAALMWFPFVLSIPAAVLLAVCWGEQGRYLSGATGRRSLGFATRVAAGSMLTLFVGYGIAIVCLHYFSLGAVLTWFGKANHGWSQNRNIVRVLFGLPRAFLYMGNDWVMFKRYLFKDPYAVVTLADLFRVSLAKMGLFYLSGLSLGVALWLSRRGREALVTLVAAAMPVLFFAVFLFESGSPERYFPMIPFLCLAGAYVLGATRLRLASGVIVIFLAVSFVTNVFSMWRPAVNRNEERMARRVRDLAPHLLPGSQVALVTFRDELMWVVGWYPFNPVNRHQSFGVFDIVEPANVRTLTWKQEFSSRVISTWTKGFDVWVTTRVWAPRPDPAWDWVEGDDPRLSWKDFLPFFGQLELARRTEGEDGFVELKQSEHNLAILRSTSLLTERSAHTLANSRVAGP
jgi:hypothetical protein